MSSLVLQALDKMTNAAAAGKKESSFFPFSSSSRSSTQLSLPVRFDRWLYLFSVCFLLRRHVFQVGLKECGACVQFDPSAYGLDWEPVQGVCVPCFMVHAGIALGDPRENNRKKVKQVVKTRVGVITAETWWDVGGFVFEKVVWRQQPACLWSFSFTLMAMLFQMTWRGSRVSPAFCEGIFFGNKNSNVKAENLNQQKMWY